MLCAAAAAGHCDLRAEQRAPPVVLANIQMLAALIDRLELHRNITEYNPRTFFFMSLRSRHKSELDVFIGFVDQLKTQCLALCLQPAANVELPAKTDSLLEFPLV